MSLLKWDRLGQDVIASSHHVNVQNNMVSDHTENSLVKISSGGRSKGDDYSVERIGFDDSLCARKTKHVVLVCLKLESCRYIIVVANVDQPTHRGSN
jgi:hypothetical protein